MRTRVFKLAPQRCVAGLIALALLATPASAATVPTVATVATVATVPQDAAPAFKPPAFQLLSQNEDWSGLANADKSALPLSQRIKHIALDDDGDVWVGFGGSVRYRYERWSDFDFGATGAAPANDGFSLLRALLHADLHLGESVRIFVEGRSSQVANRDLPGGTRPGDADSLDVQQGFLQVNLDVADGLELRAGRQSFAFGKQRLVSPLPWFNNFRSWDGASARLASGPWVWDALWAYFVPIDATGFNEADSDDLFWALHARHGAWRGLDGVELYAIGIDREAGLAGTSFNGTSGDTWRGTFGTRVFGTFDSRRFDWEIETAYQTGEVGAQNVCAWMWASQFGHTFAGAGKPRAFLGFDYASGDENPGGTVKTFDPLYPLGHAHHGYLDAIARQNVIDAYVGAQWKPHEQVTLESKVHGFWRADTADAVYRASGAPFAGTAASAAREVGQEFDVLVTWRASRHWELILGWSHFFAGDVLEDATPGDDASLAYLGAQLTF